MRAIQKLKVTGDAEVNAALRASQFPQQGFKYLDPEAPTTIHNAALVSYLCCAAEYVGAEMPPAHH